ncbi:MAG: type I restriction enzyme HsdR N-terminal domain-containing protein [Peptostreptococcaceae bacterium]|nr:type I restriction enzyme HsdR N-terminal domain-containing protein [Peptostreptococcaceae bacterium]MDU4936337.1 type I restriction enzyme HsdR N-terminal domain-containing protein [Peptostreptococcaceae bacterium]
MSQQLVKERVMKYLMEDLLVPHDMIDTDVPLSEFEEGAEGILDIIVNVKDSEDYYAPVLIVKCLDEDVQMEGETVQKQVDFLEDVDNITMAGRMILTNGNEMMYADWTGEEYDTEAELPTYDQMVKEFFEMEEKIKELEAEHHHGDGCGCGHDHGHHEERHECGCGGHDNEGGCCGGHNHDEHHECGCGHHHE